MFTNERLFTIQAFTITRVHCNCFLINCLIFILALYISADANIFRKMTEACESVKKCRKVRMLLQNQFFFMLASKMCWVCWVLLLFAGCWYIHKKYCRPIIWIYYSLLDSHAELAAELTLFEFPAYRSSFLSNRTCGSTLTHWGLFYWLLWNTCKTKQVSLVSKHF